MPARRSSVRQPAVIAHAAAHALLRRGSSTSLVRLGAVWIIVCCVAAPASAEIGATVSVFSNSRFRGYSLSDGRPVATFDFAHDNSSGLYADAAATGVLGQGGDPALLGAQLNGGFAKQLQSGTTLDFESSIRPIPIIPMAADANRTASFMPASPAAHSRHGYFCRRITPKPACGPPTAR